MDEFKDVALYLGLFLGGLLTVVLGYRKPPDKPKSDTVVTGIGMELGSRRQIDMLIEQVRRIGDILEDKKAQGIEDKLNEMLDQINRMSSEARTADGTGAARRPPRS